MSTLPENTPGSNKVSSPASSITNKDLERIQQVGTKLRTLSDELTALFPEREHLVNQIVYALLTRENVLVHGVFGTGKTDLVNAVFSAFQGSQQFSIALNKFMTEAQVIGLPDPKQMREEGIVRYQRSGGILDADLVELDEIFDANAPLLRVLLGILNEHIFKRGQQIEQAKLHTGIASTNGDPEAVIRTSPELGAVVDRFLFISQVEYLTETENRRKMYRKFVEDKRPTTQLAWSDLQAVSQLINSNAVPVHPWFIDAYDSMIQAYRDEVSKKQVISDRRACKLIKLARASALLHGRTQLHPDDLVAVKWGLCRGHEKLHHDAFAKAAMPIIEKTRKTQQQSVDELCNKLLTEYEAGVPASPGKLAADSEVLAAYRKTNQLLKNAQSLTPQLPTTAARRDALVAKLTSLSSELNARLTQ